MNNNELETRITTGALIGIVVFACLFMFPPIITTVALVTCLAWILRFEWAALAKPWGNQKWLLTFFYPILPFYTLIEINRQDPRLFALLVILVFACDTSCYFVGTWFGKTPLAPAISPHKTWEGALGGVVATNLMLILLHKLLGTPASLFYTILFATIVAMLAIAGDLFASWLKRKAQIKDTGNALPGHGGLLDRFDSLLFVGPFVYYLLL